MAVMLLLQAATFLLVVHTYNLVVASFVQNSCGRLLSLAEVNHMDLDVTNNSVENLEWCGRRYNLKYSTVFHSIHEALPEINCHEWVLVCRDITNKILNGGSKKTFDFCCYCETRSNTLPSLTILYLYGSYYD